MNKRLSRKEVPEELTWDLTDIFSSTDAWEQKMESVAEGLSQVTQYKGKLDQGQGTVLACFKAMETVMKQLYPVISYAFLKQAEDGTNPDNQTAMGRAGGLASEFDAATSFVQSELLALPENTLKEYARHPDFADFSRLLQQVIAQRPHMLHPQTEEALASLGEVLSTPERVYETSKAADMTFEDITDGDDNTHPMSFAMYEEKFEADPDPVLRRNAYASFTRGLEAYQNTYGTTWGAEVKKNVVMSRLRGHKSAIDMILHQHEVSMDVYTNLHQVILTELAPAMRKYAQLRRKVLGLDKLLYCDIEAPLDPSYQPSTNYAQASETILNGLGVLGQEYTDIIHQGLNNRWIDRADNVGKSTGAFCATIPGVHPYILTTWTDSLRTTLTLAHELGHAGHGVLTHRYQSMANSESSMFFVEAPSTINELLVANYIRSQASDDRMRCWLNMQLLMTYHHNFVRHLIEGELQRRIYAMAEEGQPITHTVLSEVQGEILAEFWQDTVEIDQGARLTWMRQPHYYRGLYPYTYSAGLTVGTAVAKAIQERGKSAAERWVEVLKAGGSKPPVELAKMAGVDMTQPTAIRDAVTYVSQLVDDVEEYFIK